MADVDPDYARYALSKLEDIHDIVVALLREREELRGAVRSLADVVDNHLDVGNEDALDEALTDVRERFPTLCPPPLEAPATGRRPADG